MALTWIMSYIVILMSFTASLIPSISAMVQHTNYVLINQFNAARKTVKTRRSKNSIFTRTDDMIN
jgi:hypothetical protein